MSIAKTYPEIFHDYEQRMWRAGGFHRPSPARDRVWNTPTGKANFKTPESFAEDPDMPGRFPDTLRLMTLRSNDQFNTTVYGYEDRFRGIHGTRNVVFMNRADIARLGFAAGERVMLRAFATDTIDRSLGNLEIVDYPIPQGCIGAYYPEANNLLPLWHYAEGSMTPAAKCIPVTVHRHAA